MLWRLRAFPDFCEPWADRPALREMEKDYLILKRASASRTSGKWSEDDFDVLADGVVVGRIMKANAAPVDAPLLWTLAFGHHEDRTPTHGYAATRRPRWRLSPRAGDESRRWQSRRLSSTRRTSQITRTP